MHVRSIDIVNVRSVRELAWELPEGTSAAGWHVILGKNGAGKSSFLRACALALVGPEDLYGLRQVGDDWLRRGAEEGSIGVVVARDRRFDKFATKGAPPNLLGAYVRIGRTSSGAQITVDPDAPVRGQSMDRSVWAPDARGWFVAGFGPFRRFDGGDEPTGRASLARNLSLFDERFALRRALTWVIDLWVSKLTSPSSGSVFDRVQSFINQEGFLPHEVRLDRVELEPRKRLMFRDAAGTEVPIEELSDGFRSALSLTLDLLRCLVEAFGADETFGPDGTVRPSGVVLIDEVDAHLHPTWQRQIGEFLVRAFPEVQFLVTTHSPLVCRSAAHGSVFLLPEPGSAESGRMLGASELDRLVYGSVLDAYATGAFGVGVEQSTAGAKKLERLAELNTKELFGALDATERAERDALRATLPSREAALSPRVSELLDQLTSSKS